MDFGGAENRLLLQLLSASSLRARVIANNISNQNVPGFQRQVVRFEELLGPALARTNGAGVSSRAAHIEPVIETDVRTPASPDGNNVSLEVEMNAMRENRLLYELYATILQGRMGLVAASISEGRGP